MAWRGCGTMTSTAKGIRWTRRRSTCSQLRPRTPPPISASNTVGGSFRLIRSDIERLGRQRGRSASSVGTSSSPKASEDSPFWRVVAFAGEDLQVVLGRFHFDFAEFSVLGRIGRIVAQRILAAELLGNLVKGFRELLFRPNGNHAPAGLLRQFVRYSRVAAISRVHDEQDMNHRIRALGRFDRFFQSYLAARVLRVGNDDNCLAPGFRSEFFTARQVDRVI